MKRGAFTLAEVLITLGIIGVVAAMTLPNLISKYDKKVATTRLKKFYTSYLQAISLSNFENSSVEGADILLSGLSPDTLIQASRVTILTPKQLSAMSRFFWESLYSSDNCLGVSKVRVFSTDGMGYSSSANFTSFCQSASSDWGSTRVSDITGMKLVSPSQRGTTWQCRCCGMPAPAFEPRLKPTL